MSKLWKKVISIILTIVMVFQMMPVTTRAGSYLESMDELDWTMPEKEEPDVVGEIEELREHTSKQFRLSDGSFAAVNYGIPIHYLDDNKNWVDVDNTLVFSENAGQYMSINGEEQRGFADTLTSGQPVFVSQYGDYTVELTLLPLNYRASIADQELLDTNEEQEVTEVAETEPESGTIEVTEAETVPEESTVPETTTENTIPLETVETVETTAPVETEEPDATEINVPEEQEESVPETSVLSTEEMPSVVAENVENETVGQEDPLIEETETEETLGENYSAEAQNTSASVEETTIPEENVAETEMPESTVQETSLPVESIPETSLSEEDISGTFPTESEDGDDPTEESEEENSDAPSCVAAIVINPGDSASLMGINGSKEDKPLSEQVLPEKMGSYVIYEGVFPGIDLMYENFGYNIKETILVNEKQDSYSYSFLLSADGLTPAMRDDGSIVLSDLMGNVIYDIPAPYMYDAAGAVSYEVEYTIEAVDDEYILNISADKEWIEESARRFPVAIDPTISVKCKYISGGTLYTTHVVQGDPGLAHNGDNEQYIGYGTGPNSTGATTIKECQIFLHVADLPDIPEGCTMVEATLQMYHYGETGYSYIGDCSTLEIAAYPVTTDGSNGNYKSWIEGLTWKTKPSFDKNKLIDFAVASDMTEGSYIQWDLTEQVESWYQTGTTNRTLALTGYESGSYSSSYCAVAVLKGYGTSNPPTLIVHYRSAIGMESYYTSQSQNIGAAGTAYVGDYNGQLVLIKNLALNSGTVMPFSLNLVYNSYYANTRFREAKSTGMYFGNGWKLDAIQSLTKCSGDLSNYMLYIDGDGTYHYFKANGSQWDDEDGLDMTITTTSIKNTAGDAVGNGYVIKNGQGEQLLFYNGLLVQRADANGNIIYFIYNGASDASGSGWVPSTASTNKLTKIIQRNDGISSDTVLASLSYSSNGKLQTVTDRAGFVYTLEYDGNNLISASSTNGLAANYSYSGGYLNEAIDVSAKYKIDYDFSEKRVAAFTEKAGTSWTAGTKILVDGSRDKTTYRNPGPDGIISNNDDVLITYLFDDEGRTINSNTTNVDQTVIYGASTGTYAVSSGTSNKNNHLMNSASIGTPTTNLLTNGSFETEDSSTEGLAKGWTYTKSGTSGMAITMKNDGHRTGNYALKTWFNSTTTGTLRAYQRVSGLTSGETYTFSAYVNTTGVTSYGSGGGVYLSVSSGGSGSSDNVNYVTSSAMDNGWTRISITFTATATSATLNVYVKNAIGIVYVDDAQLEKDDAPGNVNLIANGEMSGSVGGWKLKTNAAYASEKGLGGSSALGISATPVSLSYAHQSIPINLPYTETYVLSGWAKADAFPSNQPLYPKMKLFSLKAELHYSDETYDEYFLPFSPDIDNEWQFASMVLIPKQKKTVSSISIFCLYFQNPGTAYFDNISLIREPAQTMTYDSNGYLKSVATTNLAGDTNTYSNGNLIKTVTSGSGTFDYTYDSYHNLLTATNGLVTQTNTYDTRGNVKKSILSDSAGTEQITTSATYTSDGNRMASQTNSIGGITKYSYSGDTSKMYGLPTKVTDAEDNIVNYTYNADGSISGQSMTDVVGLTYAYTNQLLTKVTRTGGAADGVYNLSYNAFGQLTKVQVGSSRTLVTNTYNSAGALTKQTWGNGDYISYTYDELGRVKKTATETGKTVVYGYTADGQLGSVDMGSLAYDYLYDSLGRLITSSRHDSNTLKLQTRHEYDTSNRLTKQYLNLVDKTYSAQYNYDSYGRLSQVEQSNGTWDSQTTYTYDNLSRLKTVTTPVYKITYTYVSGTTQIAGIKYSAVSGNSLSGLTYGYAYDDLGNITSVTDPVSGNQTYTYDAQGQLEEAVIGGTSNTYTYDAYGNILSANGNTYTYGDSTWPDLLTAFNGQALSYDGIGNPTVYQNGRRWEFQWADGRSLVSASGTRDLTDVTATYSYDSDGLRTSKTVTTSTHTHSYSETVTAPTCTENGYTIFTCECGDSYSGEDTDALGHAYEGSNTNTSLVYTCTRCGEAYTDHDHSYSSTVTSPTCTAGGYTTYTCSCGYSYVGAEIDALDHAYESTNTQSAVIYTCSRCGDSYTEHSHFYIPSVKSPTCTERGYTDFTCECGYNYRGNYTVALGHSYNSSFVCTRCGYKMGDIGIVVPPPNPDYPIISTSIDGETDSEASTLSTNSTGTVTHNYIYASGRLIRETYGSNTLDFLYDPNGRPYAMSYNGTMYYYILNLQGDVVRMVNTSGSTVATYKYDAWGAILSATGTMAEINPLRYRGYYYDSETGFYYLQSRYYDPAIGRFINADSFASTGQGFLGYNMFAYCNNNPVNFVDSIGGFPWKATAKGLIIGLTRATTAAITSGSLSDIGSEFLLGFVDGAFSEVYKWVSLAIKIYDTIKVYVDFKGSGASNKEALSASVFSLLSFSSGDASYIKCYEELFFLTFEFGEALILDSSLEAWKRNVEYSQIEFTPSNTRLPSTVQNTGKHSGSGGGSAAFRIAFSY